MKYRDLVRMIEAAGWRFQRQQGSHLLYRSWSAYVPDLPGCTSNGETLQELKENIREAVALYLDSLRENNEPVPEPPVQADVVEAA